MVFSLTEIIEMIITVFAIGYLAMGIIVGKSYYFGVEDLKKRFLKSALIVSPAVIFHEIGHKIAAIATGNFAVYHANYFGLFIGVLAKTIGFPIIFIPAYVSINFTNYTRINHFLISISGPLVNFLMFLGSSLYLKYKKDIESELYEALFITKQVNLWLIIFNLLPFPGTDGFQALTSIFR